MGEGGERGEVREREERGKRCGRGRKEGRGVGEGALPDVLVPTESDDVKPLEL